VFPVWVPHLTPALEGTFLWEHPDPGLNIDPNKRLHSSRCRYLPIVGAGSCGLLLGTFHLGKACSGPSSYSLSAPTPILHLQVDSPLLPVAKLKITNT